MPDRKRRSSEANGELLKKSVFYYALIKSGYTRIKKAKK
jgi:hypothetical protein